jgi:hypothetical protein
MPRDKVTTFPQSGGSVYFFVIYDNFKKGDPITVSWTYLENGRVVTTVEKQAGGDFGRFIVEFQKPDSGWGKGRQNLKITGDGASASVDFTIGDALQTTPLPYTAGSGTPAGSSSGATSGTSSGASLTDRVTPSVSGIDTAGLGIGRIQKPTLTRTIPPTLHEGSGGPAPQIDTSNDVNNCGKIGNSCTAPPNANPYCYQGQCTWDCFDERRYCGDISEGCVPLYNYDNRCGNCDTKCTADQYCNVNHCEAKSSHNTGVDASAGSLAQASCPSGYSSCNGGCVNLKTDSSNCGLCGFSCPPMKGCSQGLCIAYEACHDIPCPPLTHCEVKSNIPVCVF